MLKMETVHVIRHLYRNEKLSERAIARRFASVLWFVLEYGLDSAREAVAHALEAGQLDQLSRRVQPSSALNESALPESLRQVRVEAGSAKAYDVLLEGVA